MLIGYPLGLLLRGYGFWYLAGSKFELDPGAVDAVHAAARGFLFEPARLLVTLGHLGLVVILFRRGLLGRAWPLRAMGRMALTVYSLQSIVTSLLFYAMGFVGVFGFASLMAIAALFWVASAAFCVVWLARFGTGPAEWLLRAGAYGTFRRHRGDAAAVLATSPAV